MNKNWLIFFGLCLLFFSDFSKAQVVYENYEKEKVYVQTDHVFYKPGEVMYFKIYIVNAYDNTITDKSKVVNVQLINPAGNVEKKSKYKITEGYATGDVYFPENITGGIYKLRIFTDWMQNEIGKNVFEKEITVQKIVAPRILMKLDFPQKGYASGEEVTADFSMKNLNNVPINYYQGAYTIFIDGENINQGVFVTDKEGKAQLKFYLPKNLKTNDGLLNITITYDAFVENISKKIPIALNKIDLHFFPEGGTFITGLKNNVAFKAVDEFGIPVDIKGEIINQEQKVIISFNSYHFGMGSFSINPKENEILYAKINQPEGNHSLIPLPIPNKTGVSLTISSEKKLQLTIASTQNKKIKIIGFARNKEYYSKILEIVKGENNISIDNTIFPSGISRFTVFENEVPLAERIVFLNQDKVLNIKITTNKNNYLPREKVKLDLLTTNENSEPVSANLSLGVVDDKLWTYADDKQDDILSWLLMSSELSGEVYEPNFYFKKEEPKAKKTLDLVMLTNGYRYFKLLPEIEKSDKIKFLPEKYNGIFGIVEDEKKQPVVADVYLIQQGNIEKENTIIKQETSKDGRFYFMNLDTQKRNKIIAKSLAPKQKVNIKILSYDLNANPIDKKDNPNNVDVDEVIKQIVENSERQELNPNETKNIIENKFKNKNSRSDTIKSQNIQEVVTIGYGVRANANANVSKIINNNAIINPDLQQVLTGKVSGVQIVAQNGYLGNQTNVIIRGASSVSGGQPLYVVDGIPVENFSANIDPNNINSIAILKGPEATSIYGSRGSNGVIIVNSINKNRGQINWNVTPKTYFSLFSINNDSLTQFSYAREFSFPVYKSTSTPYRYDYRETIYWNPVIQTNAEGKAQIEFYNSDANTTFRAITEGIGWNGLVGRQEKTYAAQSSIAVDAKVPPYLTMSDQPKIPLVIKNNTAETKDFRISTIVPKNIHLLKYDSIIILKPLQAKRMIIPLETGKKVQSDISFVVTSGNERETSIFPIKVEEKGFPNRFSYISSKDTLLNFSTSNPIKDTQFAKITLYKNLVSKLLGDVDRLTLEPHGCFEQLSATIYPNVFILDFLKSQNNLTTDLEAKTIKNMKNGYREMAKYEMEKGGFGYFMSSQFNLPLSAMSLLEFKDLSKYIKINKNTLERTKNAILARRNDNGTFNVDYSINKYNQELFWAQQTYTIYALSKYGITNEIENQYRTSLLRVSQTKDSYQLALMALSASYLNKTEDFKKLLNILDQQFENQNLNANSSIVGSGNFSLKSETLSLYILVLLKKENVDESKLAKVFDELNLRNGYYGFGSTQATVLALEAITQYYKKFNYSFKENDVQKIMINGNEIDLSKNETVDITHFLKDNNTFMIKSSTGKSFPYKLDWSYYTTIPPVNENTEVKISTNLQKSEIKIGDINRLNINVKNMLPYDLPMVIAKIGIPAGLSLEQNQLKDLMAKKLVSYYEISDNYLVLYWEAMKENESKVIGIDLKAEFPGFFEGKASSVYLYYTPQNKNWVSGNKVSVLED